MSTEDPCARLDESPPIPVGGRPVGIAVHPQGAPVYVANLASSGVSVIDPGSRHITSIDVGKGTAAVAVHPQGTRLYVTNYRKDRLSVIDISNGNAKVATVPLPRGPIGVAVEPSGERVYVASYLAGRVTIVGTASNSQIGRIDVGSRPAGIAIDRAGIRLFVTNAQSNTVSVIEVASQRVIKTVRVGKFPFGVAIDPDGGAFVATARDGKLFRIDPASLEANELLALGRGAAPISLGAFLAVARRCPAQALACDDGDPATMDTCEPAAGCRHARRSPLDAAREDIAALSAAYRRTTLDTTPAGRLGTLIDEASGAIAVGTPSDLARASAVLSDAANILERRLRSAGPSARDIGRLLDLARATRPQVEEARKAASSAQSSVRRTPARSAAKREGS